MNIKVGDEVVYNYPRSMHVRVLAVHKEYYVIEVIKDSQTAPKGEILTTSREKLEAEGVFT